MHTLIRLDWLPALLLAACSSTSPTHPPDDAASSSSATSTMSNASASHSNDAIDGGCLCDPATQYEYDDGTNPPTCNPLPAGCTPGSGAPCHTCVPRPTGPSAPSGTECVESATCGIIVTPLASSSDD